MNTPDTTDANLLQFRKTDRFALSMGQINEYGDVTETDRIGTAFMKPGAKLFRIKLWAFPNVQYFLARDRSKPDVYNVLALDEYKTPAGDMRSNWNQIGSGQALGSFIKFRIHPFQADLFLCLFPEEPVAQEVENAS